jgi:hypothetical protein
MALVAVATTTSGARPYQPLPTTGRLATMKVTIYGWRIKPCNVREHGTDPPKKGYRVEQFDDAWRRYAPHLRATAATAATAVTSQLSADMEAATDPLQAVPGLGDVATRSGSVAAGKPALTSDVTDVAAVADGMREDGEAWTDADDAAWQAGRLPGVDADDPRRFTR